MDSSEDDRSLPMSKWMRRTDRSDFMDMCASSPPSDGFFFNPRSNNKHQTAIGGCPPKEQKDGVQISIPKSVNSEAEDQPVACYNSDQTAFFKSFTPTTYQSGGGSEMSSGAEGPGKVLNMGSHELEKWAKKNIRGQWAVDISGQRTHASDDTAPTPIDHLPQYQRIVPQITRTDEGKSVKISDRINTEITPCSTPVVTPVCSPQVSRKVGNPFFTGEANRKNDGSWLFRPGPQNNTMLYEAQVEIKPTTGTQPSTKSVRLVPRPSKLREMNFFSPTSM